MLGGGVLLPPVPRVECPAIVGVALEDIRGVKWTLDRGEVRHLLEEVRICERQESGTSGVEVRDELGEEITAGVSFEDLAPNLVEAVTAEAGTADFVGVFAGLVEGFENAIQPLQARVKDAENALAEGGKAPFEGWMNGRKAQLTLRQSALLSETQVRLTTLRLYARSAGWQPPNGFLITP